LSLSPAAQEVQAGGIESTMEDSDELERFRREDLEASTFHRRMNLWAFAGRDHRIAGDLNMISLRPMQETLLSPFTLSLGLSAA